MLTIQDPPSTPKLIRRNENAKYAFRPGEKPHDLDTERAVLSGIILANDVLVDVQESLKAKDFFLPAHQDIFSAIQKLHFANIPIDLTTLSAKLREEGNLEKIGGLTYLSELLSVPSSSLHATEYAKIVNDLAARRSILEAAQNCIGLALSTGDTRTIASQVEKVIFAATQAKQSNSMVKLGDMLPIMMEEYERRADNQGQSIGVNTGFKDLDRMMAGFRPGQFIVLAARPGVGKTSLACNIMYHSAIKEGHNVLFFSLEMSRNEVIDRMISFVSGVDASKLRTGNLSSDDFQELFHAAEQLGGSSIFIDDRSMVTPHDILGQARRLTSQLNVQKEKSKVDFIIVDYIQIMSAGGGYENRAREVAAITGGLKAIAKEMGVPVLALSQLNRDGSKRTGESKLPQLSDLRDSGAIEADADAVLFIHREQGSNTDSRAPSEAEIIIAKQRSGPTGTIKLTWLGHLTRFADFVDSGQFGGEQY